MSFTTYQILDFFFARIFFSCSSVSLHLLTWILGVVSKQLGLLHGRVGDTHHFGKFLEPQMSELVEDAVAL